MKKIIIHIQNNNLIFSYKHNQTVREDLINTNIISDSELIFSDDYILTNKKLVIPFFKELCDMNAIDTLVFQNSKLAIFMIELFKNIKIKKVKIKKEESVPYSFCELLVGLKTITELDCYSIANFILEYLDKHHIKVTTHSEIFYMSPFIQENGLNDYSKMFYKKQIKINHVFTEEDKNDFVTFLKINRYLRVLSFMVYDRENIEFCLQALKDYRFKNVLLELYENISSADDISYLKLLNKKYKKNKFVIDLVYSDEYLSNNIMKQICLNTLRLCGIILVCLLVGTVGYIMASNYFAMQEVTSISDVVADTIDNANEEEIPDTDEEEYPIKNKYIASLLTINPDIVGYLKVNNTNIDYPVVQGQDNQYYLRRNLYQEDDNNGWIYMDYRNSDKILNDNTIIYGHNMYYSGVMFGTLHRALNSYWYTNPENLVIQFDTMYESMSWQIYSIYTIPKTSDYLRVSFKSPEDKMNYISMTKNRSITDFGIEVTSDDYLLTLSTCTGDNERLVVHAKLLENTES